MKFYKGDKVFLKENREVGWVTRVESDDLLYVEVDGMEIPVFASDISTEIPDEFLPGKKVVIPIHQPRKNTSHMEELGLFICLEPQPGLEEIKEFNIFLVNSFHTEVEFAFSFLLSDEEIFNLKTEILPQDAMLLFSIAYDQLNESPSFKLNVKRKRTDKKELSFTQKIKPNNLFNKQRALPFFSSAVYAYQLLQTWPQPVEVKKDFKQERELIIEEQVKNRLRIDKAEKEVTWGPVPDEIDLHIEKLVPNYRGMSNTEIILIQLDRFRKALEKAIIAGRDRFYVIHGVGKGKLREEISRILPEYPAVKSFKNEYHPRYGFGATEIILK